MSKCILTAQARTKVWVPSWASTWSSRIILNVVIFPLPPWPHDPRHHQPPPHLPQHQHSLPSFLSCFSTLSSSTSSFSSSTSSSSTLSSSTSSSSLPSSSSSSSTSSSATSSTQHHHPQHHPPAHHHHHRHHHHHHHCHHHRHHHHHHHHQHCHTLSSHSSTLFGLSCRDMFSMSHSKLGPWHHTYVAIGSGCLWFFAISSICSSLYILYPPVSTRLLLTSPGPRFAEGACNHLQTFFLLAKQLLCDLKQSRFLENHVRFQGIYVCFGWPIDILHNITHMYLHTFVLTYMPYFRSHHITLHCITLHYIAITLHYFTLHHYIT